MSRLTPSTSLPWIAPLTAGARNAGNPSPRAGMSTPSPGCSLSCCALYGAGSTPTSEMQRRGSARGREWLGPLVAIRVMLGLALLGVAGVLMGAHLWSLAEKWWRSGRS